MAHLRTRSTRLGAAGAILAVGVAGLTACGPEGSGDSAAQPTQTVTRTATAAPTSHAAGTSLAHPDGTSRSPRSSTHRAPTASSTTATSKPPTTTPTPTSARPSTATASPTTSPTTSPSSKPAPTAKVTARSLAAQLGCTGARDNLAAGAGMLGARSAIKCTFDGVQTDIAVFPSKTVLASAMNVAYEFSTGYPNAENARNGWVTKGDTWMVSWDDGMTPAASHTKALAAHAKVGGSTGTLRSFVR